MPIVTTHLCAWICSIYGIRPCLLVASIMRGSFTETGIINLLPFIHLTRSLTLNVISVSCSCHPSWEKMQYQKDDRNRKPIADIPIGTPPTQRSSNSSDIPGHSTFPVVAHKLPTHPQRQFQLPTSNFQLPTSKEHHPYQRYRKRQPIHIMMISK
jgi:hypothetical protein